MGGTVQSLTEVMYHLSNLLLLPVLAVLITCLAWVCVLAGGFLREWAARRLARRTLVALTVSATNDEQTWTMFAAARHGLAGHFAKTMPAINAPADLVRKRLATVEADVADSLAKLSFITRVGPMLGLLGTLIPLGPALTGLSAGNVQQLSGNLVIAFTTTVCGLLVSCLAYGMGLVRRSWYGRDMDDLEFIVGRVWPEVPRA
ncbi:MotA/TolQ/ExbB proton channel family protein [Zavarzinella formosa]|uniref:MotA/TolQ/ExbB proton channel family protein n=1 Tax=Zavarzinella formosa TaxID=360055 RepID=UPI0003084509|nr:MotA/TolQ/ExbB proton channel family protein [Zavarzinella formosa]